MQMPCDQLRIAAINRDFHGINGKIMLKPWYAVVLLGSSALMNAQAQQQPEAQPAPSVVVAGQRHASPWFRVESQHLVVYSNTSNGQVAELLNRLEKLD